MKAWFFSAAIVLASLSSAFAQDMTNDEVLRKWAQALELYKQDKDAESAALFESILPSVERIYGKDSTDAANLLISLANSHYHAGNHAKAEGYYARCVKIREARLGADHRDTVAARAALERTRRTIAAAAKGGALLSRDEVLRLWAEALELDKQQKFAEAAKTFEKFFPSAEAIYGPDSIDIANLSISLAAVYYQQGQFPKAEPLHLRSLKIREAKLGKDHSDVGNGCSNLAILYHAMGQYAKAESYFVRSLAILEAAKGKDDVDVARVLNNLAGLYVALGQYAKAEPVYLRSLDILKAKLGDQHHLVGHSLLGLGSLYHDLDQYAKAESYLEKSLVILETELGKEHTLVANCLNTLAFVYRDGGKPAKVEPSFLRSLQIREAKLGKNHPDVAQSLYNLANLYRGKAQFEKAEEHYARSMRIREDTLGKDHPDIAWSLNNRAWNFAFQRKYKPAIDMVQRSRQATAHHLAEILPSLSEKEQLTLLQTNFEWSFHRALSLGWSAPKEASAASAEWLLNGKAIAHQSLAEQQILARDARDPKARKIVQQLQQTRARLAALVNRLPKIGFEAEYQKEMKELKSREQELAQDLARAIGRPYRANPWVELKELRGKLGPKTVFVDIVRFNLFDFEKIKIHGPRYAAWITPTAGKGDVQIIDLGEAEAIDRLVEQTRRALLDGAKKLTKIGEVEAAKLLQKPLQELSTKVLHPLLPALEPFEEWIVCPDGSLWLVPWNALLLPKGEFAVEKHLIRHAVSGRDLVLELPKAKAESAYVFADPDYDLSPSKVLAAAGTIRGLSAADFVGQRLHGTIDAWKVSFDFLEDEVLIRDEEDNGAVVGKGTWKQEGDSLTIQTKFAQFQGTVSETEIRGQRTRKNSEGATVRDNFRMDRPRADVVELRSAGSALGTLPRVPRLPGTALEAEAVGPKIEKWLERAPKVFLEEKASEAMVKSIKHPRVLTLATHGYFLAAQESKAKDPIDHDPSDTKRSAELIDRAGQRIENPLLRCGLLLAGCNKRGEAKFGEDDGILTGLEIVGLDLAGCELVVLSACETGLGEVRSGEGVAGLRQAFQLAGAKAVLASLWQVPDRDTALLMNTFYTELSKGQSQAQALRQAQLQRIASRRTAFGAAHPFFWSAFALTSRGAE